MQSTNLMCTLQACTFVHWANRFHLSHSLARSFIHDYAAATKTHCTRAEYARIGATNEKKREKKIRCVALATSTHFCLCSNKWYAKIISEYCRCVFSFVLFWFFFVSSPVWVFKPRWIVKRAQTGSVRLTRISLSDYNFSLYRAARSFSSSLSPSSALFVEIHVFVGGFWWIKMVHCFRCACVRCWCSAASPHAPHQNQNTETIHTSHTHTHTMSAREQNKHICYSSLWLDCNR